MTRAEAIMRQQHAEQFLQSAQLIIELGHDDGMPSTGNTIASLAVLAGIAASDAICGAVLGERAAGDNHAEAIGLLRQASRSTSHAAQLRRLLESKTEVQYSTNLTTEPRAEELMVSARKLVEGAKLILRSLP
jgi:hypothetical protein